MEGDTIRHARFNSISTNANQLPPRYSQIFDGDGISVFEEPPPDYEVVQPDLLKSLSRTSSLASKGQPAAGEEAAGATASASDNPKPTAPVAILSVDQLCRDSNEVSVV